ncbi:hypothetical protein [Methanoregula sp.]|jgi:hypothetical protein|uniref:hypothetical protein n=1 Tax=Methanoregula sp. TaxID=2052170 RepID=UPI003567E3E0
MRKITLFSLTIITIAVLLAAGCTSSSGSSAAVPTTTVPVTSAPVTTQILITPATAITTSPTQTPTTTATLESDPILRRWVREYPTFTSEMPWAAYDFVFLSDGSVTYTFGVPINSGSSFRIVSQLKMSGTWQKIGDNKYRVSIPASSGGSQIFREYTRVPASIDKETGETINEHIVSQYEIDSLPKAREKLTNEMYYPERADS